MLRQAVQNQRNHLISPSPQSARERALSIAHYPARLGGHELNYPPGRWKYRVTRHFNYRLFFKGNEL